MTVLATGMETSQAWLSALRFVDLERFVNDRSTVAGQLMVDPAWLPESGIARPLLWAKVPRRDVDVFADPERRLDWHTHLEDGASFLFPIHWWEREQWQAFRLEERGKAWVASSLRTVVLDSSSACLLPQRIASKVMFKYHLEAEIPGVRGNRRLDPARVEKCVRLSADLRRLVESGKLHRALRFFEEPLGLVFGERGVLFREVPHSDLIPAFSFWAEQPASEPIILRFLRTDPREIPGRFVELVVRPLIEATLSAMSYGYSLEMHAQNTCFRIVACDQPLQIYYRDLEGIVYSGRLRLLRQGDDPLASTANPEIYKAEKDIYRFFNRNYDQDLTTVVTCCVDALDRHGALDEIARRWIRRQIRQVYRDALERYQLLQWDRWRGLVPWSRSPYGKPYRRSHYYRRVYR